MSQPSIGVAVVGGGMVGRAHAAAYRNAATVFDLDRPVPRLVAVADLHEPFAADAAGRYGFARAETDWRAVVDDPGVGAVSVTGANSLHREITEAALAAGKHVLCEKPLAPTLAEAQSMVAAAAAAPGQVDAVGFTFRRSPAINAIKREVEGRLGPVRHFAGNYWCDYGVDPRRPMSWRYLGGAGSGVLADIDSHLVDLAEFFCGPTAGVRGAILTTVIPDRPRPLGVAVGHAGGVRVSDERVPVENEDVCTFTTSCANGAVGTFSLSRVAFGHANTLRVDLFCENGHGQNDFFVYQARAFLDQIAGVHHLPPCPDMAHGLHNLRVLDAVVSATDKPAQL